MEKHSDQDSVPPGITDATPPEAATSPPSSEPLELLKGLGFGELHIKKALAATGSGDVDELGVPPLANSLPQPCAAPARHISLMCIVANPGAVGWVVSHQHELFDIDVPPPAPEEAGAVHEAEEGAREAAASKERNEERYEERYEERHEERNAQEWDEDCVDVWCDQRMELSLCTWYETAFFDVNEAMGDPANALDFDGKAVEAAFVRFLDMISRALALLPEVDPDDPLLDEGAALDEARYWAEALRTRSTSVHGLPVVASYCQRGKLAPYYEHVLKAFFFEHVSARAPGEPDVKSWVDFTDEARAAPHAPCHAPRHAPPRAHPRTAAPPHHMSLLDGSHIPAPSPQVYYRVAWLAHADSASHRAMFAASSRSGLVPEFRPLDLVTIAPFPEEAFGAFEPAAPMPFSMPAPLSEPAAALASPGGSDAPAAQERTSLAHHQQAGQDLVKKNPAGVPIRLRDRGIDSHDQERYVLVSQLGGLVDSLSLPVADLIRARDVVYQSAPARVSELSEAWAVVQGTLSVAVMSGRSDLGEEALLDFLRQLTADGHVQLGGAEGATPLARLWSPAAPPPSRTGQFHDGTLTESPPSEDAGAMRALRVEGLRLLLRDILHPPLDSMPAELRGMGLDGPRFKQPQRRWHSTNCLCCAST